MPVQVMTGDRWRNNMSDNFVNGLLMGVGAFVGFVIIPLFIFEWLLSAIGPWVTPTEYRAYRRWRGGKWIKMLSHKDPYWVQAPDDWQSPEEDWSHTKHET